MSVRIINSDVLEGLRALPDESVQCVVTSPPYWGLRDYGVCGQIGLELTFGEFISRLVGVFEEVRRVLKSDGVCFVNMGDSYAGSWGAQSRGDAPGELSTLSGGQVYSAPKGTHTGRMKRLPGLKPKDLIGQPWRLAFALQDAGWWLRGDYIWHKPNPMPESTQDRCTKAHEYVFHFAKSERYYWDANAIRTERTSDEDAKGFRGGSYVLGEPGPRKATGNKSIKMPDGWDTGTGGHGSFHRISNGANRRSVWTIATSPFPEAHFATFPPELPEICIKAGSRPGDTVLDPFSGAGTTALVADRLQRNAIGIEINPTYAAMSEDRIGNDRGGLLDIMESQNEGIRRTARRLPHAQGGH